MKTVQLSIIGLTYSQTQNNAYALLLGEDEGPRRLPIVIGAFEAQSIAIALEKDIRPPRPLTHDLFKNFSDRFSIIVKQVIIHKLVDGVFYSSLICENNNKEEIIDARTSDAIALALRFSAPIFTYKNILEEEESDIVLSQFKWTGIPTTLVLDSNLLILHTLNGEITANEIFELTK